VFHSYYKLPAPQTPQENCVAHNGSLVPIPGREIMVQSWYQGGLSVFDWTDIDHPKEIAYFDPPASRRADRESRAASGPCATDPHGTPDRLGRRSLDVHLLLLTFLLTGPHVGAPEVCPRRGATRQTRRCALDRPLAGVNNRREMGRLICAVPAVPAVLWRPCQRGGEGGSENEAAQRRLNFMRVQLEKLRAVYQSTKTYADKMKSFDDSASGIHAVTGLAWQARRRASMRR
jgi:hypothetical protein